MADPARSQPDRDERREAMLELNLLPLAYEERELRRLNARHLRRYVDELDAKVPRCEGETAAEMLAGIERVLRAEMISMLAQATRLPPEQVEAFVVMPRAALRVAARRLVEVRRG